MRVLLAAVAALWAAGCGSADEPSAGPGLPGGPKPPPRGAPAGRPVALIIGSAGGTLSATSSTGGGSIDVVIPAGALAADVDVTVTELTGNPPPGLAGSAWRVEPVDPGLSLPATLTLTPPSGISPAEVIAAYQDATGYWFRDYASHRSAVAVSRTTLRFGSEALVATAAQKDLAGPVLLESTEDGFTAGGQATLQYLGSVPPYDVYAVIGWFELRPGTPAGCTPISAVRQDMPLSIAELQRGAKLRWALNGRWDVTCGGAQSFVSTNFDTLGITNIGCARSYLSVPAFEETHVQGEYEINCGTNGKVTASWNLLPP